MSVLQMSTLITMRTLVWATAIGRDVRLLCSVQVLNEPYGDVLAGRLCVVENLLCIADKMQAMINRCRLPLWGCQDNPNMALQIMLRRSVGGRTDHPQMLGKSCCKRWALTTHCCWQVQKS